MIGDATGCKFDLVSAFADDLKAHTSSRIMLSIVGIVFAEWEKDTEMTFSPPKCEALASTILPNQSTLPTVKVGGLPIKVKPSIIYLGVTMTARGISSKHLTTAAAKACRVVDDMHAVGAIYRGMRARKALALWKTFVRPLWEYAMPLTPLSPSSIAAIENVEQLFWSKTIGPVALFQLQKVRFLLGLESVSERKHTLVHAFRDRVSRKAALTAAECPRKNQIEFDDFNHRFKRAEATVAANETLNALMAHAPLSKLEREAVMLRRRRQGSTKMSRPFDVPAVNHLPPVLLDDDALVRRLGYSWYLSNFPRKDLLKANGMPKSEVESCCMAVTTLAKLPTLNDTQRQQMGAALKRLNATKEPIRAPIR